MPRRGHYSVAGLLCLILIAGCGSEQYSDPNAGSAAQSPALSPTETTLPSPTAPPLHATVRGSVTFALATTDGYRGVVKLTAYEPVAFKDFPGAAPLAECAPYPDANRTALVQVDFTFTDQSPPEFPWKLGWGTDSPGLGRILGTRPGPGEPFSCYEPTSWSGQATMSVLIAIDGYFGPNSPRGNSERLHDVGADFPLVSGVLHDDIVVTANTGNVRGGISEGFTPALQIAFATRR